MAEWDVPGYTGLKKLGSGGFGDVVLARHDATGTPVAIKYLRPNLLSDPEFTQLFRAEAEVLAQVDDPHVVRLYEYVESPDGAAIVMELVDGVSLRDILSHQGATTAEAALVVLQGSLLGLAAAHQRGVVHRDYKPENVLVNGSGNSKLTDFGIAARAGDSPIPAGTMVYAPPEQFSGSPATPASDVYAATATFYESLVGRPPFTGNTAERLLYQHLSEPVPLDPVPEPLRPLVAAGMAKDPRERPADGTTFVTALNSIAAGVYGPDWEDRGRSHLGEAALLLAVLWPSAGLPTVEGDAVQQVNLSQNSHGAHEHGHGDQARHLSPEARHRWHLRHLAHLRHLEHLEHLEELESARDRRRFSPVKTALAATAAIALVGAGTALAVSATSSYKPAAAVRSVKLHQVQLHPSLAGAGSSPAPASSGLGSSPGLPGVSVKKHATRHGGSSPAAGSSSAPGSVSSSRPPSPGSGSSSRPPSPGAGSSSPAKTAPPKTPQPKISGISPSSGPAAGGTAVTITGTGLGHAGGVSFGGAAGTITADSSTQITVTSPPGSGTVNVTVSTPGGTSAATRFTYTVAAPAVTGLSPSSGPAAGGTAVTITGTGLGSASGVSFGGAGAAITGDSATRITVTSPAGSGTVDVTVTTPGGTAAAGHFTYEVPAPDVTGLSPSSGPEAGGTAVTITGTGLGGATGVSFGGAGAAITGDSATQVTVTSPAGSGTVDVTVTTPGGTAAAGQFTYEVPAPDVTGLSPSEGPDGGGTTVTISGTGLAGATVSFGGVAAKIVSDSSTQITVVSPPGKGTVDVTVTTPGGTAAAGQFTYTAIIE
jgi:serine/threonine protein kinase